jgi:hypothetical protein
MVLLTLGHLRSRFWQVLALEKTQVFPGFGDMKINIKALISNHSDH